MRRRHLLFLIAMAYIGGFFLFDRWDRTLFYGDSNGYYLHLVSAFIYKDVGDYSKSIRSLRETNPDSPDPRQDKYGIRLTEKGRRYIKYTLGVPVMEAPFFFAAHLYAKLTNTYPANGWSKPYLLAVGISTIFYILTGFYLLIGLLNHHFPEKITTYTVLAIALATNLFYHAAFVTMAHGFLFFDYCLLLLLTVRFYEHPTSWKALCIGATIGLIALTRVPEVISALIPLLWGVADRESLKARIHFFIKNYPYLLLAAVAFLAVFTIQLVYWHYVSGQLIFNPYQGEGFNFLRPRIHKGWFDFSNGWLVYTPIMAFSLIGLFFLKRYFSAPLLATLTFVGLHAYIHYSYYAWTYFPGFGSRPMVETYPLLSYSLAASFSFFYNKRWLYWIPLTALIAFTGLNLFQTWQQKQGIIWTERGNWAFYYETFGRLQSSRNALRAFDTKVLQPDSTTLSLVETLASEGFEDFSQPFRDSALAYKGTYSLLTIPERVTLMDHAYLSGVQPHDWLRVGIHAYMNRQDKIWDRDRCAMLFLELYDENNRKRETIYLRISPHIGNANNSIWSTGEPDRWGEAAFFIRMPRRVNSNWHFKIYIENPFKQQLYLDELRVEQYRPSQREWRGPGRI